MFRGLRYFYLTLHWSFSLQLSELCKNLYKILITKSDGQLLRFSFRIQIPTFLISSEFAIFRQLNSSFYLTIFAKIPKQGVKRQKKRPFGKLIVE